MNTPQIVSDGSQVLLSEVGDAFRISLCLINSERKVVYMNKSFGYDCRVDPKEAIGKPESFIIQNSICEDVFLFKCPFSRSIQREERNIFLTAIPVLDEAGEVAYVGLTIENEQSLAEIRRSFEDLVSKITGSIHIKSLDEQLRPLIGNHHSMKELKNFIKLIGPSDASVMITGESGTGKEIVADCIQALSNRKDAPYVKINCAAIPANLLESELFGYEPGAFTGANKTRKEGLLEIANKGTLFLDEIGDMPAEMQPKLLRALQHGEIYRIGGRAVHKIDVRVIAATNSDLGKKIEAGLFRQDLYYRLAVIPIKVPPLRERGSDISVLTNHFLSIFCEKYRKNLFISDEIRNLLSSYTWPGNIRELQNVIEYYVVCSQNEQGLSAQQVKRVMRDDGSGASISTTLEERMAAVEREILLSTIENYPSLRQAAKALNIDSSTLCRKARRYGITLKNESE